MTAENHNKIITDAKTIAGTMQVSSEVLVQKELSDQRHWANFVGWMPGEFIFLDGPRLLVKAGLSVQGKRSDFALFAFGHHVRFYDQGL